MGISLSKAFSTEPVVSTEAETSPSAETAPISEAAARVATLLKLAKLHNFLVYCDPASGSSSELKSEDYVAMWNLNEKIFGSLNPIVDSIAAPDMTRIKQIPVLSRDSIEKMQSAIEGKPLTCSSPEGVQRALLEMSNIAKALCFSDENHAKFIASVYDGLAIASLLEQSENANKWLTKMYNGDAREACVQALFLQMAKQGSDCWRLDDASLYGRPEAPIFLLGALNAIYVQPIARSDKEVQREIIGKCETIAAQVPELEEFLAELRPKLEKMFAAIGSDDE